jgi:sarcosine oxidase/L-pipecolate oxidase
MSNQYDVVVIGGGPIGLASAYRCTKARKSEVLLERFNFFNQSGSSNDLHVCSVRCTRRTSWGNS